MNIENEFNKIVSGLKEFRNHDFLENEIKKSFLEMIYKLEGKRVIIRGAGIHTEHFLDNIKREGYLSKINILAIVDDILCGEEIEGIKIINKNMQEKIKYDSVVISSFSYRKEMKKDYDGNKINLVDLYDELEKKNIILTAPYYFYRKGFYETSLYLKSKYEANKSEENLVLLINSLLVLKDFVSAFKYIDIYINNKYSNYMVYSDVKNNLKQLINSIKHYINNQNLNHIIMYWIDAVPFEKLKYIPYLHNKKDESLFFERVYSSCPNTHPTMHTIFQETQRIDDYLFSKKKISEENSKLLREIRDAGYEFKYIGHVADNHIEKEYIYLEDESVFDDDKFSFSMCDTYWKMLQKIIDTKVPLFVIVHTICETHRPFISFGVGENYSYKFKEAINSNQIECNYKYINEELKFYNEIIPNNIVKIYMSDHGINFMRNEWNFLERKIRTFCIIDGGNIKPAKIEEILSYKNMIYVIKFILTNEKGYIQKAVDKYALLQDVDLYNKSRVNKTIKENNHIYGMAYRCVVTKFDKFIKIANGKEIYYKLENENINLIDCAEYKDRIEQLRRLAGNYFLNIKEIPEFANALKLYKKEKGNVYWITGLSGAGKTTIGKLLYNRIKDKKDNVIFLDGDVLREVYQTKDYSNEGRLNLALQHGRLCKMLSEQGIDVVICVIAMYDECRQWNHDNIENYHEIYLRVSIDELIRRDQKQLYSRVLKKEISNVMGMDIPFEEPKNPEVIIDNNGNDSPEQIINKISEKFDI